MILVTGASGKLGYLVAKELEKQQVKMRLLVRNKSKAPKISNAEVVVGDYSDMASLEKAFKGVDKAFIVSLHMAPMERAMMHRNAFTAAKKAGVEFIVYTSFQGASPNATFSMGKDHHQSEWYLKESGLTYAALRNSFYAGTAHEEVNNGKILNPVGDGKVSWVAHEDIAQLAAWLLLHPLKESETMDVTGPEAISFSQLAALLSELTGKKIEFDTESYEEGLKWRKQFGLTDWDLEAWMTSDMSKGRGENKSVGNAIERFLGRKALSLREYYQQHPELLKKIE